MKNHSKSLIFLSCFYIIALFFLYIKLPNQKTIVQNTENGSVISHDNTISTSHLSLRPGCYTLAFNYHASADTPIIIYANINQTMFITLPAADHSYSLALDLQYDTDDFKINIQNPDNKTIILNSISIYSEKPFNNDLIYAVCIITIFYIFCIYYYVYKEKKLYPHTILLATALFLSSLPLFRTTLTHISGQDLLVHLSRIEGIKDGILAGQFPVKIYPDSYWGYGILGALYPDILLYPAAFLRICGISSVLSYETLLFFLNTATIVSMYQCVKSITKHNSGLNTALLSAILYTFAPYRLNCLYIRSALGEALAMIFLPLVITGLYHLLIGNRQKYYYLIIGYTGILYAHLLSMIFAAVFSIIIGIFYLRKLFRPERLFLLIKTICMVFLLNAFFLVSFFYYKNTSLNTSELYRDFSASRITLSQLFSFFANQYTEAGILKDHPGIGPIGMITAVLIVYLLFSAKKSSNKTFCIFLSFFSFLCLFMTTIFCPWNILQQNQTIGKLLGIIQFSWRLLGIATAAQIIALALLLSETRDKIKNILSVALISISCICIIPIFYVHMLQPATITRTSGGLTEGRTDEYLPAGTEITMYQKTYASLSDYNAIHAENYIKNGTTISFQYTCTGQNEYVDLPLLFYPGYQAVYINSSNYADSGILELNTGENNCIRLSLKQTNTPYIVTIKYKSPWFFIPAFIISAVSLVTAVFCHLKKAV